MSFGKKFRSVFWKCLLIFGIITAVLIGIVAGVVSVLYSKGSKAKIDYDALNLNFSSVIYYTDKNGNEVEFDQIYGQQNRLWANISDMPAYLPQAFVAIEDERFYSHYGFDLPRTVKATFNYVFKKDASFGGSTINQQLVKNLTGYDETSAARKVTEIIEAIKMDKKLSKTQILELYLNTIYLSQGCNGVETAANKYFGKTVSELTLAECASIAGITQYPSRYDPIVNPEANKKKQELVLKKMLELEMITKAEYDQAVAEKLNIQNNDTAAAANTKSYFTDHVIEEVVTILERELDINRAMATQMVYSGGLQIYTTIDPEIQGAVDEVFENPENTINYNPDDPIQAAIVIMDPYTGKIRGVGGGLGEKTSERALNRATMSLRQPGSTIKPLSVYAPGFEYKKFTLGTVFEDSECVVRNKQIYNYYSGYKGPMTVKTAIEQSTNTVAVRALEKVGIDKSYDFLIKEFKFSTIDSRDKDYSPLALGGLTKGVSVLEMTAAYSTFVNKGIYTYPYTVEMIKDNSGNVIYEHSKKSDVAMSESTASTTLSALESVVNYGTGTPAKLPNMPAGGKTGSTDDYKDRWFMGVTPYYTAGVWVGYDDPKTISGYSVNPAVALWKAVMEKVHKDLQYKDFEVSKTETSAINLCMDSQKLATDLCYQDYRGSRVVVEYVGKTNIPSEVCDLHKSVTVDVTTGKIAGPECNLSDTEVRVQPSDGTEEICTHSSVSQSGAEE